MWFPLLKDDKEHQLLMGVLGRPTKESYRERLEAQLAQLAEEVPQEDLLELVKGVVGEQAGEADPTPLSVAAWLVRNPLENLVEAVQLELEEGKQGAKGLLAKELENRYREHDLEALLRLI
jgi:hypothetical protein